MTVAPDRYYNRKKQNLIVYYLTHFVVWFIFHFIYSHRIVYCDESVQEQIKSSTGLFTGPVVLAITHTHPLETVLVPTMFWDRLTGFKRLMWSVTKIELFKNPVLAWFLSSTGSIPINRDKPDRATIRAIRRILKDKHVLQIYPQGERRKTRDIGDLKPGLAALVKGSQSTILPIDLRYITQGQHNWLRSIVILVGLPFASATLSEAEVMAQIEAQFKLLRSMKV